MQARVNLAYNLQVVGKMKQAWCQFSIAIAQDSSWSIELIYAKDVMLDSL